MEAVGSSETSLKLYRTTWHHFPEDDLFKVTALRTYNETFYYSGYKSVVHGPLGVRKIFSIIK
jgi:hypothetical protein